MNNCYWIELDLLKLVILCKVFFTLLPW